MASGREHRPFDVRPEQPLRGSRHQEQVVDFGSDPAENSEDELKEERPLVEFLVDHVSQIVDVAEVVAFELEPHPMPLSEPVHDGLDVLEGIVEVGGLSPSRKGFSQSQR